MFNNPVLRRTVEAVQYYSEFYQGLRAKHGVRCSMTNGHDCNQFAFSERVNGILKTEFLLHRPNDAAEALRMIGESVPIYNNKRSHLPPKY